jgi:hypothetical protein
MLMARAISSLVFISSTPGALAAAARPEKALASSGAAPR